jgi:hypothetical protein
LLKQFAEMRKLMKQIASMRRTSQTNAIVLRIRKEKRPSSSAFAAEEVPV